MKGKRKKIKRVVLGQGYLWHDRRLVGLFIGDDYVRLKGVRFSDRKVRLVCEVMG